MCFIILEATNEPVTAAYETAICEIREVADTLLVFRNLLKSVQKALEIDRLHQRDKTQLLQ